MDLLRKWKTEAPALSTLRAVHSALIGPHFAQLYARQYNSVLDGDTMGELSEDPERPLTWAVDYGVLAAFTAGEKDGQLPARLAELALQLDPGVRKKIPLQICGAEEAVGAMTDALASLKNGLSVAEAFRGAAEKCGWSALPDWLRQVASEEEAGNSLREVFWKNRAPIPFRVLLSSAVEVHAQRRERIQQALEAILQGYSI